MKLVRFGPAGAERPGLIDPDGRIRDLSQYLPDLAGDQLDPARLADLARLNLDALPAVAPEARLGPCVGHPGKIVCVGLNYRSLAELTQAPLPEEPVVFLKAPSALCGACDPMELPATSRQVDWEVELAVIIGRRGRNIRTADAMTHVAGFAVFNDISERIWQFGTAGYALRGISGSHNGGQWDKGKNHDGFAPLGPWLVTTDEVAEPGNLDLWLDVDGERMQASNTRDMLFSIPELVEDISRYMRLDPGDIIATGTPPGSGFLLRPEARYLCAGQQLRAGISGLGEQCREVVASRD